MPELQLTATGKEQERILAYLETNASEELAKKINAGTPFEKDGKQLINKKTLAGFMKYACEEARKHAGQGATSTCIDSDTVFGWATHYFEEDAIVGTLYREDGSEYIPEKKKSTTTESKAPSLPTPAPKAEVLRDVQFSLFDGPDLPALKEEHVEERTTEDEIAAKEAADETAPLATEKPMQEIPREITVSDGETTVKVNTDTGECTEAERFADYRNSVDEEIACRLLKLLDRQLDLM